MNYDAEYEKLIAKCKGIVADCGITLPELKFSINDRLSRSLGRCNRKIRNGVTKYDIEVAGRYLRAYIDSGETKNIEDTILHEMCHSLPNCFNHGSEWQYQASKINRKYGYDIKRCYTPDEIINANRYGDRPCVTIHCTKCGHDVVKPKTSAVAKDITHYHCGACNGKLEIIQNKA